MPRVAGATRFRWAGPPNRPELLLQPPELLDLFPMLSQLADQAHEDGVLGVAGRLPVQADRIQWNSEKTSATPFNGALVSA